MNEELTGMLNVESILPPSISMSQLGCNSMACLKNTEVVKIVELQDQFTCASTVNLLFSNDVNFAKEFISIIGAKMAPLSPIISD